MWNIYCIKPGMNGVLIRKWENEMMLFICEDTQVLNFRERERRESYENEQLWEANECAVDKMRFGNIFLV